MSEELKFLIYNTPDNSAMIDVVVKDDTIWATQSAIALLFGIDRSGIGRHLKNIFEEGELNEKVVSAEIAHTTPHGAIPGKTQEQTPKFYSLDAITGQTAAEIVHSKADRTKINMGLTTWKKSPNGRILKSDSEIAKNYLTETEVRRLERGVGGYFDYVEDLIENEQTFTMADFSKSIDNFINFRNWKVLDGKGKISHEQAMRKAHSEYDEFNKIQKIVSDFDKQLQDEN